MLDFLRANVFSYEFPIGEKSGFEGELGTEFEKPVAVEDLRENSQTKGLIGLLGIDLGCKR